MTLDANIINFSALPFYKSAEGQNAKRWWIYDVYQLYASNKTLIPFQIVRQHKSPRIEVEGITHNDSYIDVSGEIQQGGTEKVYEFTPSQFNGYVVVTAGGRESGVESECLVAVLDAYGNIIPSEWDLVNSDWYDGMAVDYTGELPQGAAKILVSSEVGTKVYKPDVAVAEVFGQNGDSWLMDLSIVYGADYDVLMGIPASLNLPVGKYYIVVNDEYGESWISDIMTVVEDGFLQIGNYVKLEWYDQSDLVADSGMISYQNGYKNVIYLRSDLAKPEYIYEEDGENRDGYFFPEKQISKKRYKFGFYAPEYLLDVLRLVRLADYAKVTYKGREYQCSEILLTPTWESEGDVALVEVEFDTNTVVKAVGRILQ